VRDAEWRSGLALTERSALASRLIPTLATAHFATPAYLLSTSAPGISSFISRPSANIHLTAFCNNVDHAWIMAEKYHLKLVLNWFGHYASGDGTIYRNLTGELFVPMYIARDEKTHPRVVDAVDADAPAADSGTNPAPGGSSSCIGGHLTAKSQTGQLAHLVQIR